MSQTPKAEERDPENGYLYCGKCGCSCRGAGHSLAHGHAYDPFAEPRQRRSRVRLASDHAGGSRKAEKVLRALGL